MTSVRNLTRDTSLGTHVQVADRWWKRLVGLLGRSSLEAGEGLILRPCKAVHMLGMRFPLDVAFVDREGRIIATYPDLSPGARTRWHRSADAAIELPVGTLSRSGTQEGDVLSEDRQA